MDKKQNTILMAVILSETSHVFCCVLPTVFSLLSLLSGVGMISALPAGWVAVHDFMHEWEVPMIILSGVILALGWGLFLYSQKVDCHDTGCHHGPCTPKKNNTRLILKIATGLFLVNIAIYGIVHRGMDIGISQPASVMQGGNHQH